MPYASTDGASHWMSVGFINDKFSAHCQRAQGRPFLRTGVRPANGFRCELTIILSSNERQQQRGNMPFRLSGEVIECGIGIAPVPSLEGPEDPCVGKYVAHDAAAVDGSSSVAKTRAISTLLPSTTADDCGISGGSIALGHMVRSLIIQQHPTLTAITPKQLLSAWYLMSSEKKERVLGGIAKKLGAVHGQRVVCQGR